MVKTVEPLTDREVGPYAEMAARPNPRRLVMQPVPSLAATLLSVEQTKGEPLTKREVEALRDSVNVVAVSAEAAEAVEVNRGYKDIEPSRAWEEWQVLRTQLS